VNLIESALARPYCGYYPTMAGKCAALLHGVVANHGFIDGNKRTAWLPVEILVARSGHALAIADDEPIDDLVVAVAVAAGACDLPDLVERFRPRLTRTDPPTPSPGSAPRARG
jgi:death-on-curing protein